jgi:hypothetical protein
LLGLGEVDPRRQTAGSDRLCAAVIRGELVFLLGLLGGGGQGSLGDACGPLEALVLHLAQLIWAALRDRPIK